MDSSAFNNGVPGGGIILWLALFGAIIAATILACMAGFGLWWTVNHVAFR